MPDLPIKVVDLFAGPGGLSEGFSSLSNAHNQRLFKVAISIESDQYAHRTLELRAFFRQFPRIPDEYYEYVKGNVIRDELFARYADEARNAREEAWHGELGKLGEKEVDQRITKALNGDDDWVLIGGPPCQAYSLVGRSRIRGEDPEKYEKDARHFLYREYLRILAKHAPPVFVMENVKGLLSAKVKQQSILTRILSDLSMPSKSLGVRTAGGPLEYRLVPVVDPGINLLGEYAPENFIVKAERFGIPQARHRIIIVGIRADLCKTPRALAPSNAPSIDDVIQDLPRLRSGLSKKQDSAESWCKAIRALTDQKWFLNGEIDDGLRDALRRTASRLNVKSGRGNEFVVNSRKPKSYAEWYLDPRLDGVPNHATRGHIEEDLHRYLFATVYAEIKGRTPLLQDFPTPLLPSHKNVNDALKETKFNDRFRVQIKGRVSTTIVSHISKDGHYFIHYDPTQCRSLTVREAARLQTFPDNYFFEGPRTEQYKQVGNAVPPLLARQIAEVIAGLFD